MPGEGTGWEGGCIGGVVGAFYGSQARAYRWWIAHGDTAM